MNERDTLEALNKLYEKKGFVNMGETPIYPHKLITRRPSVNYLTDGGFPKGRLILHAGEKSSGKSSMLSKHVENYMKKSFTLTLNIL